jgi:ribosomal protein L24
MARIRKGDEVVMRAGKDKGKRGTVLSVGETQSWWKESTWPSAI